MDLASFLEAIGKGLGLWGNKKRLTPQVWKCQYGSRDLSCHRCTAIRYLSSHTENITRPYLYSKQSDAANCWRLLSEGKMQHNRLRVPGWEEPSAAAVKPDPGFEATQTGVSGRDGQQDCNAAGSPANGTSPCARRFQLNSQTLAAIVFVLAYRLYSNKASDSSSQRDQIV